MNISSFHSSLPKLNLPEFGFDIRQDGAFAEIYDPLRKKWVKLLPEEWIRQNLLRMLIEHLDYPASRIKIEQKIEYKGLYKMADILAYDKKLSPYLLIECKAAEISLRQGVLDQLGLYNSKLKARYIGISNGQLHYFFRYDPAAGKYEIMDTFPAYGDNI